MSTVDSRNGGQSENLQAMYDVYDVFCKHFLQQYKNLPITYFLLRYISIIYRKRKYVIGKF